MKQTLLGLNGTEMRALVKELGMPAFTASQIMDWIYKKKVFSIDDITNISLKNRQLLKEGYETGAVPPVEAIRSQDGTVKYLFQVAEKSFVEAVYIPEEERATLCISSQVGCKMSCKFCMTGKQGFSGNLTAGEILNQIYALPERDTLTNVVFMGMGEPCDNLEEVLKAVSLLTSEEGFAWSPRRITISTVGLRKGLKRLVEECDCHIAISLHTPTPAQRSQLIPAERAFPMTEAIALLKNYDFSKQRRLSFEYIVFKGINDSFTSADQLLKLLRGVDCRINLISYHAIPGVDLEGVDREKMIALRDYLTNNGLFTTLRASRGEDIYAACGMLSTTKKDNN